MTKISSEFRRHRLNMGLNQKGFAQILGIAQGYLSEIESGQKVPSTTLISLFKITASGWNASQPDSATWTKKHSSKNVLSSKNEHPVSKEKEMYKQKYLVLADQHISALQEIISLREELTKLKAMARPPRESGKGA